MLWDIPWRARRQKPGAGGSFTTSRPSDNLETGSRFGEHIFFFCFLMILVVTFKFWKMFLVEPKDESLVQKRVLLQVGLLMI